MGYQLLKLSLQQIFSNWKLAVRLSWLIVIIDVSATLLSQKQLAANSADAQVTSEALLNTMSIVIPHLVVVVLGITSIAISWHRFILRDEIKVGALPFQSIKLIGSYLWCGIKVSAIGLIVWVPIFIMFQLFGNNLIPDVGAKLSGLPSVIYSVYLNTTTLITGALFTWLGMRFGLILPAIAVGNDMSVYESYRLTAKFNRHVIVAAVLVTLLTTVPHFLISGALAFLEIQMMSTFINVFQTVFMWFGSLVSIGMLTVLYGHIVEGRPL